MPYWLLRALHTVGVFAKGKNVLFFYSCPKCSKKTNFVNNDNPWPETSEAVSHHWVCGRCGHSVLLSDLTVAHIIKNGEAAFVPCLEERT